MYNDSLYRVSLKCFIKNSEGKVLVVKEAGRSVWDLPGGGIEHGENIKAAIARELDEEINFKGNFTYKIMRVDEPAKLLTRDVWQLRLIFKVILDSSEVGVGKDADEILFIDPKTLKDTGNSTEQKIYEYTKIY